MLSITFMHRCWNDEKQELYFKELLKHEMDDNKFEEYIENNASLMDFMKDITITSFVSNTDKDIMEIFNIVIFDLNVQGCSCPLEECVFLVSRVKITRI